MTRNLRSRSPLLAAALAAVAIPVGAEAASAATVHVFGPTHPKVDKNFAVGASGKTGKRRVLQVTIHRHGKCKATYGADKQSGSFIALARFVKGEYSEKRGKLHFTEKTNGHYCAYLGDPEDLQTDPPVASDSKHFQVVEAQR
jgi:hypothetical protein